MKSGTNLGMFGGHSFVYFDKTSPNLIVSYEEMKRYVPLLVDKGIDAGILVDDIAGIFFDLSQYSTAILISIAYVHPDFRQKGIYTRLHQLVDVVAREKGKKTVYTYIDIKNDLMNDLVAEKIGYKPVMTLMKREVSLELSDEAQR